MSLARTAAVLTAAALLVGCGAEPKRTQFAEPFEKARARFDGQFDGRLELDDGVSLESSSGRDLAGWVCGRARMAGDRCVEASRIRSVHYETVDYPPPNPIVVVVGYILFSPFIAAMEWSEHQDLKTAERIAFEEEARVRNMRARGEPVPRRATTEEYLRERQFYSLANCMEVEERPDTSGDILAEQVWRERGLCLAEASDWLRDGGDLERARRLYLIDQARERYERMACGSDDHSLNAPRDDNTVLAGPGWMEEYRTVVADARTYDYVSDWYQCRLEAPYEYREPTAEAREAARIEALAEFPLTDLPNA